MTRSRRVPNALRNHLLESLTLQWMVAALLITSILCLPAICAAQSLLSGPQKIVIDAAHDRLLVSNYNTGDLVQIDSAGNQTYFVQGAEFIDGMAIAGNTVYGAAPNKRIKGYDLDTGLATMDVPFSGLGYLSSVVADNSGHLYISCPLRNRILKMRISDASTWTFAATGLTAPNGMIFQEDENRLVVIEDRANPSILAVSLADSTVTPLATTPLAGGDGIEQDMAGHYYVTGYYLPGIYEFDADFNLIPEMLYTGNGIVYPTYDASDNSLLVTFYDANAWARIPLAPSGIRPTEPSGSFLLRQSRPNPFVSRTTIGFALDTRAHARLDVYDVVGRPVRTLLDEAKGPGDYSVEWDGRGDAGNRVAHGMYYVRLQVDDMVQTQRAVWAQ